MRRVARFLAASVLSLSLLACAQHYRLTDRDEIPAADPAHLRVATHNVHYILLGRDTGPWSRADWERRKPALNAAFRALDADIVAFQEMESFLRGSDGSVNLARDYLARENPDYAVAASGDWREFPSTQPVFYRKSRLQVIDQGWFFFSDTPDVIYSRTFNGSYPAFASWVEFATRDARRFRVYNLHFEYRSASNRRLSAQLVARRIAPVLAEGMPILVLGDTNALHGWRTMDILRDAGLTFLRPGAATYHLNRGVNLLGAIDHIGLSAGIAPRRGPWVVQRQFGGVWPSDHYPVVADVALE